MTGNGWRLEAELLAAQQEAREAKVAEELIREELSRARMDLESDRARRAADAERFREGLAALQASADREIDALRERVARLERDGDEVRRLRAEWEPVELRADVPVPTPTEPADVGEPADVDNPFARVPAWPPGARGLWRCEIGWDAGWAESTFTALAYAPRRRRGRSIAASASLPWLLMGRPDPDSAAHCEALHRLECDLERAGWEQVARGADWYSTRFSWPHEQRPSELRASASVGSSGDRCRETGAPDVYDS
jgi:hypothetical protein